MSTINKTLTALLAAQGGDPTSPIYARLPFNPTTCAIRILTLYQGRGDYPIENRETDGIRYWCPLADLSPFECTLEKLEEETIQWIWTERLDVEMIGGPPHANAPSK